MTIWRAAFLLVLVGVVFSWLQEAGAASLTVSPLQLYLTPQNARGVINVRNPETSPVLVQAQGFLWTQKNGKDQLATTRDLIVVPPVFTLQPNGEQVVRVGFRRPPKAGSELSYRVILSQVPDKSNPVGGVSVVLHLSLPVFVTPRSAVAKTEWSAEALGQRELRIRLQNSGLAHVRITGMKVLSPVRGDDPFAERTGIAYVLAGATGEWTLMLNRPLSSDNVILKVETNLGDIEETIPVRQ